MAASNPPNRSVSRARQVVAAACVAAVGFVGQAAGAPSGATAATAPTVRPTVVGAVTDLTWGVSRPNIDRTVGLLKANGVRWVRLNVSWKGVQPDGPTKYNTGWLAELDYAVRAARTAGLQVLMPVADGVPYWASADPAKTTVAGKRTWNHMWRPASMPAFGTFVGFVARRYVPMGVRTFEIWNEPNHPAFWPSGVRAEDYLPMLKAGYTAVKRVDPTLTVLHGGLSKSDAPYLQALYRAGGRSFFDVANIHPYTGSVSPTVCWKDASGKLAKDAFCGIKAVRDVMVANGDSAKKLWLTEFGWSTTTSTYGVTEAQQASYLTQAYQQLKTMPYVSHAFWYGFRNTYWLHDAPHDYEANHGLLRTDFRPKPALRALAAIATAR